MKGETHLRGQTQEEIYKHSQGERHTVKGKETQEEIYMNIEEERHAIEERETRS